MVVFMNAAEIENDGNVVFCKIIMVRTVVKPVRIVRRVKGIIQLNICVVCVCLFRYFM